MNVQNGIVKASTRGSIELRKKNKRTSKTDRQVELNQSFTGLIGTAELTKRLNNMSKSGILMEKNQDMPY